MWQTGQRLATAIQEVTVEGDKLTIEAPTYHALMGGVCEPNGYFYETPAQASEREAKWPTRHRVGVGSDQTENNCMRDPFLYKDKRTGKRYLAFEANTGAGFHALGHIRAGYVSANGLPKSVCKR
ncbi:MULTISPECIES: glycoside hydrolase family 68 protein [unclassified Zymobacter]|uniref:glycoside hydrolase family 68 protein n=1 Tax=unclassified Zymobacter TaxID=3048685 RepID=UPI0039C45BAC